MLKLRNFNDNDIFVLKKYRYHDEDAKSILDKINLWNSKYSDGKYYEMFAMVDSDNVVGMVSLYQHTNSIISCGPEVFEKYRKQGYGSQAVCKALDIAKNKVYKIAVAQIKIDNLASIGLHEKLGFEMDHKYTNKRGNEVCFYIKSI